MKYEYVDAHVHLYQFNETELKYLLNSKKFIFLAVAEDISSSLKNIKLSLLYENIIPAIGIHPWNVKKYSIEDIRHIEEIINKNNIRILGEIGLDKKFVPQTYDKQKEFFIKFLELAREYDLAVNIHSVNTHREVFDLLLKYDITRAYFHWYTGPLDLINDIISQGYFIGINVAIFTQEKHKKVLEKASVDGIITESDGPYNYKGTVLHPDKIPDLVNFIANAKNMDEKELIVKIKNNFSKFIT